MSTADEVFDSWEEMEESGALDKKLNSLQLASSECLEDAQLTSLMTGKNSTSTRMIILGEDGVRSQYVPPRPTVKILKRPQHEASQGSGDGTHLSNGDRPAQPKQPIKSLKQREQEYAEARRRILGEERSPEEQTSQEVSKIQGKQGNGVGPNNFSNNNNNNNNGSGSGSSSNSSSGYLSSNVIRMPLGPDGTSGFNLRR